jgi:hypothetical protein
LVLAVCPQTQAKALYELYRPFIKNLALHEVEPKPAAVHCPTGAVEPVLGRFPDGKTLASYAVPLREGRFGSAVALLLDGQGHVEQGWCPSTALDLGPIDYSNVGCRFVHPWIPGSTLRDAFTLKADCERSETVTREQSGTITVVLEKNRLRGIAKASGKPTRQHVLIDYRPGQ